MYAVGMLTLVFFIFHTFVISGKLTLNLNCNILGCQVVFFLFESVRFHCIVWALGGSFSVIVHIWLHVSCKDFSLTINLTNYWKVIWYLELGNWWYTHKVSTYQFQTWDKKNQIFSQFNIYPVFKIKTSRHLSNVYYSNLLIFQTRTGTRQKQRTTRNQPISRLMSSVYTANRKWHVSRLCARLAPRNSTMPGCRWRATCRLSMPWRWWYNISQKM